MSTKIILVIIVIILVSTNILMVCRWFFIRRRQNRILTKIKEKIFINESTYQLLKEYKGWLDPEYRSYALEELEKRGLTREEIDEFLMAIREIKE
jgi:hypothetical protein